jgi:hypothetical protein
VAAAEVLRAQSLTRLALLSDDVEHVREAVAGLRHAADAWPELVRPRLGSVLLEQAVFEARADSPELEALWQKDRRVYSSAVLLHRARQTPEGERALAALRSRPEVAEAAALLRRRPADSMSVWTYVAAQVADDADLEQSASAALERERVRLRHEIDLAIDPSEPETAYLADLLPPH